MDYSDSPKIGSAPQLQYSSRKVQRGYEPSSRPQGLLIGGLAIAASAMAADSTPESYSLPREAMPYLPENKRNQIYQEIKSRLGKLGAFYSGKDNLEKRLAA